MTIQSIVDHVQKNMLGRIADEQGNTALMAKTAMCDGDHLEIGTLHGGSAIVVALLKRELGFTGRVVCVDPLDGYYPNSKRYKRVDPLTAVPVSVETLRKNMQRFDVELEIIKAYSVPFPDVLQGRTFATAYIDGNHDGETPMQDFFNVSRIVTKYITFDNCGPRWPAVLRACEYAETIWQPHKRQGISCIVKHP
jgi:hypothetical protein